MGHEQLAERLQRSNMFIYVHIISDFLYNHHIFMLIFYKQFKNILLFIIILQNISISFNYYIR